MGLGKLGAIYRELSIYYAAQAPVSSDSKMKNIEKKMKRSQKLLKMWCRLMVFSHSSLKMLYHLSEGLKFQLSEAG